MDFSGSGSSYWCYRCNRFTGIRVLDPLRCPDCGGGFVEDLGPRSPTLQSPAAINDSPPRLRRGGGGDRSPFNPVIVLPGGGSYELYYDEGVGSGLQRLPAGVSEFLMGSGFDRLLAQMGRSETDPPASKLAVRSMPAVRIAAAQVVEDLHCAVCKERFEFDSEAREMPCKHIYHSDCILPWLSIKNSCPVCRRELGGDPAEEAVGMTIWRLPRGGFAVGRFNAAERELPAVYTEIDGGGGGGYDPVAGAGAPVGRRANWAPVGRRPRESSGLGRAFRSFIALFHRSSTTPSTTTASTRARSESGFTMRSLSTSMFGRSSRRRGRSPNIENNEW